MKLILGAKEMKLETPVFGVLLLMLQPVVCEIYT